MKTIIKGVIVIAVAGMSAYVQAAPGASARPAVRPGVANPSTVTPGAAGSVAVPGVGIGSTGAMMTVPGANANAAAAGLTTGSVNAAGAADLTVQEGLTAAEAASLRAALSEGVLSELNTAQATLLGSVNSINEAQEAGLDRFVTSTVPSWKCGDACARTVTESLNAGATAAADAVGQGQQVSAGKAFSMGLNSLGILSAAKTNCPTELGSVIGGI